MTEPRPRRAARDESGVSLIELLIVLVVVAIGVLALSGVQTRSSTDVYATGRHTRGLQLAQTRMEMTRAAGFAAAQSDSGVSGSFGWRTVVDSADVGLRGVHVTVWWTDRGRASAVQLHNLLAQR